MAMTISPAPPRAALINIGALGVATSVTLVVLYLLCAVVAMALPNIALSHAWLTLFTTAPIGSMWGLQLGRGPLTRRRANHVCL
jgi:hypothetical protein